MVVRAAIVGFGTPMQQHEWEFVPRILCQTGLDRSPHAGRPELPDTYLGLTCGLEQAGDSPSRVAGRQSVVENHSTIEHSLVSDFSCWAAADSPESGLGLYVLTWYPLIHFPLDSPAQDPWYQHPRALHTLKGVSAWAFCTLPCGCHVVPSVLLLSSFSSASRSCNIFSSCYSVHAASISSMIIVSTTSLLHPLEDCTSS